MTDSLRIGIAGLGTVGTAVVKILQEKQDLVAERCGRKIDVVAVSARDRQKKRNVDITNLPWFDDAREMAVGPDLDLVVELIGGEDGVAKAVCENALAAGRHVVTANKALLAHHGMALAEEAEKVGVGLSYEAAVAGGIPIIKALREGFVGNHISSIYGILNGTCNYILTTMRETGRPFSDVLSEAQELGYAEADPTFDIDGTDTAHKLALLASVAFGAEVNFSAVHVEGIRRVTPADIEFSDELGFRIKLLGIARKNNTGIEQSVYPCMVSKDMPLAHIEGVFNAVVAVGDELGTGVLQGQGAGAKPTASAVIADIVDIARGRIYPSFSVPVTGLKAFNRISISERVGPYYVRLTVVDRPGVIADISAALRDEEVSVEALIQRGISEEGSVPVVLTLHETLEGAVQRALARIELLDSVVEPPCMIRIEQF